MQALKHVTHYSSSFQLRSSVLGCINHFPHVWKCFQHWPWRCDTKGCQGSQGFVTRCTLHGSHKVRHSLICIDMLLLSRLLDELLHAGKLCVCPQRRHTLLVHLQHCAHCIFRISPIKVHPSERFNSSLFDGLMSAPDQAKHLIEGLLCHWQFSQTELNHNVDGLSHVRWHPAAQEHTQACFGIIEDFHKFEALRVAIIHLLQCCSLLLLLLCVLRALICCFHLLQQLLYLSALTATTNQSWAIRMRCYQRPYKLHRGLPREGRGVLHPSGTDLKSLWP
mmetsp:Transcript_33802/g.77155  ORF Transcript_33802/g.77155 Transcript_33802/m.77155 type:complete len:279 (+) Transcript_33802:355-1191(+)